MTPLSTALQQTLTTTLGAARAAAVTEAAADETGAQTAEYGILTLAAVGFAGVLAVVLTSPEVQGLLVDLVSQALSRD
ncbi:DUF4244 domain-containing protein [Micrococcus sp.]|uniref:DUF4244 domain-containing protein n=1 Tax=Micrococcus sp. TaxID=1271 RepID=UPI0026DCD8E9|nr:DUF4244 domain-containing protein [Micrococcus sp.]MDO4238966.1 DUF4244 domain-containing protein [Micrococcus sp.]